MKPAPKPAQADAEIRARTVRKQGCPPCFQQTKEVVMNMVIGVDPHKASHTTVAIEEAVT